MSFRTLVCVMAIALLPLTLAACAAQTTCKVTVNALAAEAYTGPAQQGSYYLFPEDPDVGRDDLLFKEVCNRLKPLLAAKGMPVTEDVRQADFVAFVSYGSGPTRTVPHPQASPSLGIGLGYGHGWGTFTGLSLTQPVYSDSYDDVHTQYLRIVAFAVDKAKKEIGRQIWIVETQSSSDSDDFRTILPGMLKPAEEYIGTDTGGYKKFEVTLRAGQEPQSSGR